MKQKVEIKLIKILWCCFLIFAVIFLILIVSGAGTSKKNVSALDSPVWEGGTAEFAEGNGSSDSPFKISSGEELAFLAEKVNEGDTDYNGEDKFYILTKNIVLNKTTGWENWGTEDFDDTELNKWTPIGLYDDVDRSIAFSANFDGKNFSIKGLYVNGTEYQGLFGYIQNGNISNLKIEKSCTKGDLNVGGIVGRIGSGSIINCYNSGNVYAVNESGGGIAGLAGSDIISNCFNAGSISGNRDIGGIVGHFMGWILENCRNTGDISGSINVGGIAGNLFRITISNCSNAGSISGGKYTGGIMGNVKMSMSTNLYNTGNVSSGEDCTGGIAGYAYLGTLKDCFNAGGVSSDGNNTGGIAGFREDGNTSNCYNTGDILGGGDFTGGIAGYVEIGNTSNCYNTGGILGGGDNTGSIIGYIEDDDTVENCYFLEGTAAKDIGNDAGSAIAFDEDYNFAADDKGYNDTDNLLDALNEWVKDDDGIYFTYLDWTALKFNSNGGSAVNMRIILNGAKIIKPFDPVKVGFEFSGWFKDINCTISWNFDTDTVTGDITLYAKWLAPNEQFEVVFNSGGGSAVNGQTVDDGGKLTKPNDPKKEGYIFDGWYTKDGTSNDWGVKWNFETDTITDGLTLYAKWKPANGGLSQGEIAGIVIGCVAVLGVCIFLIFLFKKRKSDKKTD